MAKLAYSKGDAERRRPVSTTEGIARSDRDRQSCQGDDCFTLVVKGGINGTFPETAELEGRRRCIGE
jgi:hypothetical protein